ncbi:hypothetical protein [Clostridium sp. UBA6640]|nr:hypothetical protein [Clostridium sp. UBA6640]
MDSVNPNSFNESEVGQFRSNSSKRPGQPAELAEDYLYLASDLSSLHLER